MSNIADQVAAVLEGWERAIRHEFPEALFLIDYAKAEITGATSEDDLDRRVEAFFGYAVEVYTEEFPEEEITEADFAGAFHACF